MKNLHLPPLKSFVFLLLIPVTTIITSYWLSLHPGLISKPGLTTAVTIDLLVLIPLSWLIGIYPHRSGRFTIVPVVLLLVLYARLILPDKNQVALQFFISYVFPVLELLLISLLSVKAYRTVVAIRRKKQEDGDTYEIIREECEEITGNGKVALILATEVAMLYYAFGEWNTNTPQNNSYTSHKESGVVSIMAGILLLIATETFWLHHYLIAVNAILAWVVTGLSIYSALQIYAHIKALRSRKHQVGPEFLKLRYGLFAEVSIPYTSIIAIDRTIESPLGKEEKKLALLGEFEPHNLLIKVKEPVTIVRPYGIRTKTRVIFFQCDRSEHFIEDVTKRINISEK